MYGVVEEKRRSDNKIQYKGKAGNGGSGKKNFLRDALHTDFIIKQRNRIDKKHV